MQERHRDNSLHQFHWILTRQIFGIDSVLYHWWFWVFSEEWDRLHHWKILPCFEFCVHVMNPMLFYKNDFCLMNHFKNLAFCSCHGIWSCQGKWQDSDVSCMSFHQYTITQETWCWAWGTCLGARMIVPWEFVHRTSQCRFCASLVISFLKFILVLQFKKMVVLG